MSRFFRHITLLFVVASIAWSCDVTRDLNQVNLAHLYQQDGVVLKPFFRIHHRNEDTSRVYFEGSSDQLLYVKEQSNNNFIARIGVKYRLYTDYERTTLIDSGSTTLTDIQDNPETSIVFGHFDLFFSRHSHNDKYVLEVVLIDKNRSLTYLDLMDVDRSDKQSRQSFLLTTPTGRVIFQNHYPLNVPFSLKHSSGASSYKVRFYQRDFPIAATPYAKNVDQSFSYKADSTFTVTNTDSIVLQERGFYHFQLDESSKSGFTVFSFYNEYPFVTLKKNLGPPLRYLTTNEEYAKIDVEDPNDMKFAADRFWLGQAGTVDRGKLLVSTYYNRVEAANMFFTSYIEGWKTDRGIIYVILGPPTEVNRNEFQEYWIYGDANSSLNHVYTFTRLKNPFSDNDYSLTRSNSYRYGWGQAIEAWRNGQVYGIKEIKRAQDERDRQQRANTPPYFWY
jgi:GWxTD domain-containing protein